MFTMSMVGFVKILNINKGSLDVGNDADLCILDINKPWIVKQNELKVRKTIKIEDWRIREFENWRIGDLWRIGEGENSEV